MSNQKLTHDQIRLIRHLYKTSDISMRELGRMFKVSAAHIGRIIKRKTCAGIKDWLSDEDMRLGREAEINNIPQIRSNKKLTDKQVIEIRDSYTFDNISMRALAKEYGVSARHIGRIINGDQRKEI